MQNKNTIFSAVTTQVIELMKTVESTEFQQPWVDIKDGRLPHNAFSDHYYNGINLLNLSMGGMEKQRQYNGYLTVNQANKEGARIKKGEKATHVFYKDFFYIDAKGEFVCYPSKLDKIPLAQKKDLQKRYFLKAHPVFSIEQCEGLPEKYFDLKSLESLTPPSQEKAAEELILLSGAKIEFKPMDGAHYVELTDTITLPDRRQFHNKEGYYSTALHELGHWTGHRDRLNRLEENPKLKNYAFEELVAELFSAFALARLGVSMPMTNNAAYLKSWISALENDNRYIFRAAAEAQKAVDYLDSLIKSKLTSLEAA
jgi:antirestriction protein ArdC